MVRQAMKNRSPRPDQSSVWEQDDIAIGFVRLQITGSLEEGKQPQSFQNKTIVTNGEIYNSEALLKRYELPFSSCDTDVILPLYQRIGEEIQMNWMDFTRRLFLIKPRYCYMSFATTLARSRCLLARHQIMYLYQAKSKPLIQLSGSKKSH